MSGYYIVHFCIHHQNIWVSCGTNPDLLFIGYPGLFPWVKWLGCEADHSPLSNAEVSE